MTNNVKANKPKRKWVKMIILAVVIVLGCLVGVLVGNAFLAAL